MEGALKTSPINAGVAGINISSQLELCRFAGSEELWLLSHFTYVTLPYLCPSKVTHRVLNQSMQLALV
jgi:hypothetical protein